MPEQPLRMWKVTAWLEWKRQVGVGIMAQGHAGHRSYLSTENLPWHAKHRAWLSPHIRRRAEQAVTEARTLSPRPLLREVIGTPLPVSGLAQDWPEAEPARREQPAQAASAGSMPTGPAGNSDHNVNSFL